MDETREREKLKFKEKIKIKEEASNYNSVNLRKFREIIFSFSENKYWLMIDRNDLNVKKK